MSSATTNANPTPAQEEFQELLNKNSGSDSHRLHPEDREEARRDRGHSDEDDEDEDDRYRNDQINAAMRMPNLTSGSADPGQNFKLPPASFSSAGHSTGVKGVIADARAYEEARQTRWRDKVRATRRSVFGMAGLATKAKEVVPKDDNSEGEHDEDEEAFLQQWRETRLQELEQEQQTRIRNRRTSPSLRMFGRLDTVDALGYLDAIEKVGRETTVVVFVYDNEVSSHIPLSPSPPLSLPRSSQPQLDHTSTAYKSGIPVLTHLFFPHIVPSIGTHSPGHEAHDHRVSLCAFRQDPLRGY
jgi:hypothetical protein